MSMNIYKKWYDTKKECCVYAKLSQDKHLLLVYIPISIDKSVTNITIERTRIMAIQLPSRAYSIDKREFKRVIKRLFNY